MFHTITYNVILKFLLNTREMINNPRKSKFIY